VPEKISSLIWFLLTFEGRVSRKAYLTYGGLLVILKYGVDVALVGLGAHSFWTPLDYLQSAPFLLDSRLSGASPYLAPALAVWTLPFIWVGMTMTIRRLLDVGWSAWWSVLFFVPFLSYCLLGVLALAPSGWVEQELHAPPSRESARLPSALTSMGYGAGVGLGMMWLGVYWIETYGLALFMGTPVAIGLATGYALCRQYPASVRETTEVIVMTVVLVAGSALALGVEGAVCILMVAPLGLVLAWMGGMMGRFIAGRGEAAMRGGVLIAVLLPGTAITEVGTESGVLREVRSSVEIHASAQRVWDEVVAFSPIPEPRETLFKLGIAYPMRAEIEGVGVGAIRYCVFSTGAFVEPITHWEPGVRLSFDVTESPPPLRELTLWDVSPPHLDGYLRPQRGEFRLIGLSEGVTRLEGSTWYEQRLRPEGYWVVFSDYVIGVIHRRVLEHIKGQVETDGTDVVAMGAS